MNEETFSSLKRLIRLRNEGIITQAEFRQQRAALLLNPTSISPSPMIPDESKPDVVLERLPIKDTPDVW
jgi:hypothetical protein